MADFVRRISTRQVLALVRVKLGVAVYLGKLERVIADLERSERLEGPRGREAWATPDDVDAIEGELRRMRAGWYQKRNVRGDYDAWLEGDDGQRYRIRLPYERSWNTQRGEEDMTVANVVGTWEWPTARLTGALVRDTEQGDDLVYRWTSADEMSDEERALLVGQWLTADKSAVTETA